MCSPNYLPFDTADHTNVLNRRLKFIAAGANTFTLAVIEQRQAHLKEFFKNGAKVLLDRGDADSEVRLRALEAPESTLGGQPWFREVKKAIKERQIADVDEVSLVQRVRI